MSSNPFHLGWFVDGFRVPSWNSTWSGSSDTDWVTTDFYADMARSLERAGFDVMLLADSAYVGNTYAGSSEMYLKQAQQAPRHDPAALAPLLAHATKRLGIVPTLTTTEWRPFQVARYVATVDHLSGGRAGWNIVTGGSSLAAANYGVDELPSHDQRYDMADEFTEIACQLWSSWEPDAVVKDRDAGVYADHTKVHTIDYEGQYFSSRGPLTTFRSPQGRPVILQAGISPRGRAFAAKHADLIVGIGTTIGAMKEFREDIHARLIANGRKPTDCKVLFLVEQPIVADTDAEAQERARQLRLHDEEHVLARLCAVSSNFQFDLSRLDLDRPLPADLLSEGHGGALASWIESGRTVRELVGGGTEAEMADRGALVGSPSTVAGLMGEYNDETGADGFFFLNTFLDRRYIAEITDGLIPALQRRGLTRSHYEFETFRENLFAF